MATGTGKAWTGVYPIAPTPFTSPGELDTAGMRRIIDCLLTRVSTAFASSPIIPSSSCSPTPSATPCSICASHKSPAAYR